jgi:hypothetical protein
MNTSLVAMPDQPGCHRPATVLIVVGPVLLIMAGIEYQPNVRSVLTTKPLFD